MGKGDKKTAKGKRFRGSFGVSRKRKVKTSAFVPKKSAGPAGTDAVKKPVEEAVKAKKKPPVKKTAKKTTAKKAATKKPGAKAAKK